MSAIGDLLINLGQKLPETLRKRQEEADAQARQDDQDQAQAEKDPDWGQRDGHDAERMGDRVAEVMWGQQTAHEHVQGEDDRHDAAHTDGYAA